jgi:hypothetical protein
VDCVTVYVGIKQNEIMSTVLQHEPCKSPNMQISRWHKRCSLILSIKQSSFLTSMFFYDFNFDEKPLCLELRCYTYGVFVSFFFHQVN